MTAKSFYYEMVCDRKVIELRYDDIVREVRKLQRPIDEREMWCRDYSGPPGLQRTEGQNRYFALFLLTKISHGKVQTNTSVIDNPLMTYNKN